MLKISIFLTLFIGEPPCGGFPWEIRQNWTLTHILTFHTQEHVEQIHF